MISVLLLAKNFLRQNRWLLLAFALWPLVLGSVVRSSSGETTSSDREEIVQQDTFYGLAVVGFLASSAIYNEKRSRRIVAVLSKAVSRTQYLLGFLLGSICFAGAYFASVVVSVVWAMGSHMEPASAVAWMAQALVACLWISSVALMFATFLHPLIAAALTGAAAFAPLASTHRNAILAPMAILIESLNANVRSVNWAGILTAAIESGIFVAAASLIFARRDLTVSIE